MNTTRDLGRLVGLIELEARGVNGFLADPITRASGCADELLPGVVEKAAIRVELLLRRHGYEHYDSFVDEVAARTSARWVYFESMLHMFDSDSGPFYEYQSPNGIEFVAGLAQQEAAWEDRTERTNR